LTLTPAKSANLSRHSTQQARARWTSPIRDDASPRPQARRPGYIVIENFGLASSTGLGLDHEEEACRKRLNLAASVERASAHLSVVLPALLEVQIDLVGDFRTEALAQTADLSQSRFHTVSPKPFGETVKRYTLGLRPERAAFRLLSETADVATIAFDLGF
jgi:transcriptional regulator GlxA family with amidase domain